jgi:Male sterility protein
VVDEPTAPRKRSNTGSRATSIVRRLAGKNVFVTGVTGFLGQAVFERLLLDFPETRITLLVRPQLGSTGRQRVESLMGRPMFNALRDKVGTDGIAAGPLYALRSCEPFARSAPGGSFGRRARITRWTLRPFGGLIASGPPPRDGGLRCAPPAL